MPKTRFVLQKNRLIGLNMYEYNLWQILIQEYAKRSLQPNSQITYWGDKVNSSIGLSYRPASHVAWCAGTTTPQSGIYELGYYSRSAGTKGASEKGDIQRTIQRPTPSHSFISSSVLSVFMFNPIFTRSGSYWSGTCLKTYLGNLFSVKYCMRDEMGPEPEFVNV